MFITHPPPSETCITTEEHARVAFQRRSYNAHSNYDTRSRLGSEDRNGACHRIQLGKPLWQMQRTVLCLKIRKHEKYLLPLFVKMNIMKILTYNEVSECKLTMSHAICRPSLSTKNARKGLHSPPRSNVIKVEMCSGPTRLNPADKVIWDAI